MKAIFNSLTLLLVLGLSAAVIGDESEIPQYFPGTLGSYWVYVDEDGNEFTRRVVQRSEIADEIPHGFDYEPALENAIDYDPHIHPDIFRVGEEGIAFFVGKEAKKALQGRFVKELGTFLKTMEAGGAKAGLDLLYAVEVEVQDPFYLLSTFTTVNEKWTAMQVKATLTLTADPSGTPDEFRNEFTIVEKGKVLGIERVETPAGTFKDCLKVEYRTYTGMAVFPEDAAEINAEPPGETLTTLWIAPNVGIVKFHQKAEDILLKTIPIPEIESVVSTTVRTLELKRYEFKSVDSQGEGGD